MLMSNNSNNKVHTFCRQF